MNARVPEFEPSTPNALNAAQALDQISRQWDGDIVRQLNRYIAIPAKSPKIGRASCRERVSLVV